MVLKARQKRYVAYFRVSTVKQGRSGLGLEAQQSIVNEFIRQTNGTLINKFVEVESGNQDTNRPQLQAALKACRQTRATLLIAKLDRLSRSAAFLMTLQEANTPFVACDMPEMNETVVGIMAVIARTERKMIGERTRVALQAAKQKGVKLGNPRLKAGNAMSALAASLANQEAARARASDLVDVVEDARNQGHTTLRAIASHMNNLGIATPRGGVWFASSVKNLLKQLAA